jgi:hypothetical protein
MQKGMGSTNGVVYSYSYNSHQMERRSVVAEIANT